VNTPQTPPGKPSGGLRCSPWSGIAVHFQRNPHQSGAVSEARLSAIPGWEKLPGTPVQKAEGFLLADACTSFTQAALLASLLLLANGTVLSVLWCRHAPAGAKGRPE
jgi:hypothetical protein